MGKWVVPGLRTKNTKIPIKNRQKITLDDCSIGGNLPVMAKHEKLGAAMGRTCLEISGIPLTQKSNLYSHSKCPIGNSGESWESHEFHSRIKGLQSPLRSGIPLISHSYSTIYIRIYMISYIYHQP